MTTATELATWRNGTPTGGPEGDGRYPLTYADGLTYLVFCPAAQALNPLVTEQPVQVFAEAAQAAATTATTKAGQAETSRIAAAASASNAATSASTALTNKNAAATSATTASTAATNAGTSATAAAASESTASAASASAITARDKAEQWADEAQDVVVEGGAYSAKHWAQKAQAAVTGTLKYKGTWDATGAFPGSPVTGDFWKVSVAGGGYDIGDQILYNGSGWDKIDNTELVTSVAGRTGAVVITKADVGLSNVDNTGDAAKPISTATQTALDGKQAVLGYTPLNIAGGDVTGKIRILFNSPALSANAYNDGQIELQTGDGTFPRIGFHRAGLTAAALYYGGSDGIGPIMGIRDNTNADYRIAYTNSSADFVAATYTATGNITSQVGNFIGQTANVVLAPSGAAGNILLRPNGPGSNTGQLLITTSAITWAGQSVWHGGNFTPSSKQDVLGFTPANKAGDTFTGQTQVGSTFRVTGATDFSSGTGLELYFSGDRSYIVSLQRGTITWKDIHVYGNGIQLYSGGDLAFSVTSASEFARKVANSTATMRIPRVFVQSGDPGAQAADGDLWIW